MMSLKKKSNQKSKKNIIERIKKKEASKNLFNKQIKEILELDKKIYGIKG